MGGAEGVVVGVVATVLLFFMDSQPVKERHSVQSDEERASSSSAPALEKCKALIKFFFPETEENKHPEVPDVLDMFKMDLESQKVIQ